MTPIEEYLEQALRAFEAALAAHPVRESPIIRAEQLVGARWFVGFLLGKPLPNPFADRK